MNKKEINYMKKIKRNQNIADKIEKFKESFGIPPNQLEQLNRFSYYVFKKVLSKKQKDECIKFIEGEIC